VRPQAHQPGDFAPNSQLEITPEFLNDLILHVRARGYETLPLAHVEERLKQPASAKQRFAVFTLDDGYQDNLDHAHPVFEKLGCPYTVYVAPRIAEGTCELWWRGLELAIKNNSSVSASLAGQAITLSANTTAEKWQAWKRLAPSVQAMNEYEQRQWIRSFTSDHGVDLEALCRDAAMTWDSLRTMAKSPLASIGAHTLNHYNLRKLPAADAKREIEQSGAIIAQQLGRPVEHFAYPYGNVDAAGPREFAIAKQSGYKTAVVTRLGPVLPQHGAHMQALPRIMVSGRFQQLTSIDALLSGVPSRLAHGFRSLNVN
jgi:peptidoglycan/xylan/chitin deacetylase (PgdA/CDA1 family)